MQNDGLIDMNFYWVPGFEGRYKINRDGVLVSVKRTVKYCTGKEVELKTKILKPYCSEINGCSFTFEGKTKKYLHRILAELFIPNPEGFKRVEHLDGDIYNNSLSNLKWSNKTKPCRLVPKKNLIPTPSWLEINRDLEVPINEETKRNIIDEYVPLHNGYIKLSKKYNIPVRQIWMLLKDIKRPLENKLNLYCWDFGMLINDEYSDDELNKIDEE